MPTFGYTCCCCKKRIQKAKLRKVNLNSVELCNFFRQNVKRDLTDNDYLCNKCLNRYYFAKRTNSTCGASSCEQENRDGPSTSKIPNKSPCNIKLPILGKGGNNLKCIFCNKRNRKLVSVPDNIKTDIFIEKGILLSKRSRCCKIHLKGNKLKSEIYDNIEASSEETYINRTGLYNILENVRSVANKSKHKRIDFSTDSELADEDYVSLTGLNIEQFDDLCSNVSSLRDTSVRSKRTALAIFLTKLRTGLSNRILKVLFGVNCRFSIQRAVNSARSALMTDFVPNNIGFDHITRDDVIQQHTRPLAKHLFSPDSHNVILVLDGTYIYIQKSSNYAFQRRSFSMHKNRPLVKPMMIVSSTGYIVSVLGPYYADGKNNDARITKHMFVNNSESINNWIKPDDILIVDRGFRDSIEFLNNLGIQSEMPFFLPKKQKQHSTTEANTSRLVTSIRWVVESANGRIKQWKSLDNVVPNSQIPFIGANVKIVCAICNKYRSDLITKSSTFEEALALKMLQLSQSPNRLQERIETNNLIRKYSKWIPLTETSVCNFPKMTEGEIRDLTLGVYQIKQAKNYTLEHSSDKGQYDIYLSTDTEDLLKVKIQSRHTTSKQYNVFIEYNNAEVNGWFCQCKAGARTVGMCAHIASIVWYLAYARYTNISLKRNYDQFLEDAANLPESGSDDSECSDSSNVD